MPLLEKDVKARNEHDPAMDEYTNLSCRSMIAAPVSTDDRIIGVLSAVRFEKKGDAFSLQHLDQLVEVSQVIAGDLEPREGDDVA
jgi:transcriptional regulator with GAF, ATPase, and Fis domain